MFSTTPFSLERQVRWSGSAAINAIGPLETRQINQASRLRNGLALDFAVVSYMELWCCGGPFTHKCETAVLYQCYLLKRKLYVTAYVGK